MNKTAMPFCQINHRLLGLFLATFVILSVPLSAEAGLFSALAKLSRKVDVPDVHGSAFRFADELGNYPKGSVAEVSFSHGQDQWLVKMPDGKSVSVDKFATEVAGSGHQPTLFLSEKNLPLSLDAFERIPAGVDIRIKSRNGKSFTFVPRPEANRLVDRNISVKVTDIKALKDAIWQLQRPAISSNPRLVQLSSNADAALPAQSYGSKVPIDSVGVNQLHNAIASMRQQSLVISATVQDGFLLSGKQKVSLAELEQAAAQRDVSLIILDSAKPKKTLQRVADSVQKESATPGNYSTGDFYNLFLPEKASVPVDVDIAPSGQLRDLLHVEYDPPRPNASSESVGAEVALLSARVLVRAASLYRPNEARTKELDDRIHPLVPSWVLIVLIASLVLGLVAFHTSWSLFKRVWDAPSRASFNNGFLFALVYLLHKLAFLLFYLPLLGFFSPIYLTAVWTYRFINFFLIRPARWVFNAIR